MSFAATDMSAVPTDSCETMLSYFIANPGLQIMTDHIVIFTSRDQIEVRNRSTWSQSVITGSVDRFYVFQPEQHFLIMEQGREGPIDFSRRHNWAAALCALFNAHPVLASQYADQLVKIDRETANIAERTRLNDNALRALGEKTAEWRAAHLTDYDPFDALAKAA